MCNVDYRVQAMNSCYTVLSRESQEPVQVQYKNIFIYSGSNHLGEDAGQRNYSSGTPSPRFLFVCFVFRFFSFFLHWGLHCSWGLQAVEKSRVGESEADGQRDLY